GSQLVVREPARPARKMAVRHDDSAARKRQHPLLLPLDALVAHAQLHRSIQNRALQEDPRREAVGLHRTGCAVKSTRRADVAFRPQGWLLVESAVLRRARLDGREQTRYAATSEGPAGCQRSKMGTCD